MGRAPCCEKVGLKKGRWTAEEDEILMKYIEANGEGSWRSLPKNAGLLRCGKSCRLRWINYLRADLKRGVISVEEEDIIIKLHATFANRWSLIAGHLPGRTDNEIKNYWNSHLSRRISTFSRFGGGVPMIMNVGKLAGLKRKCGRNSRVGFKRTSGNGETRKEKEEKRGSSVVAPKELSLCPTATVEGETGSSSLERESMVSVPYEERESMVPGPNGEVERIVLDKHELTESRVVDPFEDMESVILGLSEGIESGIISLSEEIESWMLGSTEEAEIEIWGLNEETGSGALCLAGEMCKGVMWQNEERESGVMGLNEGKKSGMMGVSEERGYSERNRECCSQPGSSWDDWENLDLGLLGVEGEEVLSWLWDSENWEEEFEGVGEHKQQSFADWLLSDDADAL